MPKSYIFNYISDIECCKPMTLRNLILLFFLLLGQFQLVHGQEPKITYKLHQPENRLYWGFNNELNIAVDGIPANEIFLKNEKNLAVSGENGKYILKAKIGHKEASVDIYHKDKFLESIDFNARPFPPVMLYLGDYGMGSFAELKKIKSDPCIYARHSDFNVRGDFTISRIEVFYSIKK